MSDTKRPRATSTRHFDGDAVNDWPHEGACPGCREAHVCNVCASPIRRASRCTNGRCLQCHAAACTPGGATSPGHGFGSHEAALRALARRRKA